MTRFTSILRASKFLIVVFLIYAQLGLGNNFSSDAPTYISHIRAVFKYQQNELLAGSNDGLFLFNKKTLKSSKINAPSDPSSLADKNVYSIKKSGFREMD